MQEEAALLAAVGRGQTGAIDDLYDCFGPRLYGFGLRLLGDGGLAEELVQETFIRLWKQASKFDPRKGNARTFVFTIARRLAVDIWRRPSSRPLKLDREETGTNHVEDVVTSVVVREALSSLSPVHREVLELLHFQQLTQSETARALGIPLGTVKARSFHAVRALRDALEERGVHA